MPNPEYALISVPVNMKAVLKYLLLTLLLILPALAYAGSTENPRYWIKKLKSPDAVVMDSAGVSALNSYILEKNPQMADIGSFDEFVTGQTLLEWLLDDPLPSPDRGYKRFANDGAPLTEDFFEDLAANMNLEGVGTDVRVRFAVVTERADIRAFPTDESALKSPSRQEFDMFQYSSIYPPEEAALLHTSGDGQWGYFQTALVRGWIRLDKVAFAEGRVEKDGSGFLVVSGSKAEVYSDDAFKKTAGTVPMGAVLRVNGDKAKSKSAWAVFYPERNGDGSLKWATAYIKKSADANEGYLPYTRANAIKQAFKMLGEGYGWGGKDGKRDCSEFIKDLFATMGLRLPRNSGQQVLSGDVKALAGDRLSEAIKKADPGVTLLGMPGHIMLHIGERKGRPFVIHQVSRFMDNGRMKVLSKVAVTGLTAGKKPNQAGLKEKIHGVTELIYPFTYEDISNKGVGKGKS